MTLKLGTPIPYDEIDEILDEHYIWTSYIYDRERTGIIYHAVRPIDDPTKTNHGPIMSLKDDNERATDYYREEDEDGYINWPGNFSYTWRAGPDWDDDRVDRHLHIGIYGSQRPVPNQGDNE